MKLKAKKFLYFLLALGVILAPLSAAAPIAWAADDVCSIDGTGYSTLNEALTAVGVGETKTITLLQDIDYSGDIVVGSKSITLDLNHYTLNLTTYSGTYGVNAGSGGILAVTGDGAFNVSGSSRGVYSHDGGSVTVTNLSTSDGTGVAAFAENNGEITVLGDITMNTTGDATGACVKTGGKVTVNGTIAAGTYLTIEETNYSANQMAAVTTKTGYCTYTDGTSTVWVKSVSSPSVIEFSSSSLSTGEGTSSSSTIGVVRSVSTSGAVSVTYTTIDGTAAAGTGYTAYSGTLSWADGEGGTKYIPYATLDDSVDNGSLTYSYSLSNPTGGATLGAISALAVQIDDNDTHHESSGGSGSSTTTIPVTSVRGHNHLTTRTEIQSSVSDSGDASATVSGTVMDALLKKAAETGGIGHNDIIEVVADAAEKVNGISVSIAQTDIKALSAVTDSKFSISSPFITMIFDDKAMEHIAGAANGGNAMISAIAADPGALSETERQKVGSSPIYSLSVTVGGEPVSDFGGGWATVTIPYTLNNGENPHAIVVYYLSSDGSLTTVRGHYNADSGTVTFITAHFSTFVIRYNQVAFADVKEANWYYDAVSFIAAREITKGQLGDQFCPESALTRGQFITMLMKAYSKDPDENPTVNFADAGDKYYTNYLAAAKRLGIINGMGGDKFAPDSEITRQDMFTMLYRMLDELNALPESVSDNTPSDFSDFEDVSDYAADAVSTLIARGIITGNDGNLNPEDQCTRAEMAQILYNLLQK